MNSSDDRYRFCNLCGYKTLFLNVGCCFTCRPLSTPPVENSNLSGASEGADGQGVCTQHVDLVACDAALVLMYRKSADAEPKRGYYRRYWQEKAREVEGRLARYADCVLRGYHPSEARAMRVYEAVL